MVRVEICGIRTPEAALKRKTGTMRLRRMVTGIGAEHWDKEPSPAPPVPREIINGTG
ncbi:MAG: hypothetical protein ABSA82_02240 [Thermacetogeniaceae bacterium]|jgi:hypothetical protein